MAQRFRFRLEVIERLRRRARDAQRRVVADAVSEVQRVERRVEELTQHLADAVERKRSVQEADRVNLASLRSHQIYKGYLHRMILQGGRELGEREAVVREERDRLAESSKRLKVMELLRDRHWQRHQTQVRREEQGAADEAALQGFLRGRRIRDCEVAT